MGGADKWGPTLRDASEPGPSRLGLLVIADGAVESFPLPESGRIGVGRAPHNDVRVEDPLVSREHCAFRIGAELEVEDLGSANGTKVSGARLTANEIRPIVPGQVVEIGSTMLVVQHGPAMARPRRLWTHSFFEMRLEEACAQNVHRPGEGGDDTDHGFAVVRLHVEGEADEALMQEALTSVLRPGDVVASYAPGEYELLLTHTTRARAERTLDRLTEKLDDEHLEVRTGLAAFPGDGRTPDALLQHACAALRGGDSMEQPPDEVVVTDPAMRDLYRVAERIAQGTISVLLLGETGVGKEIFAETVHRLSPRRDKPFVRINCAALSESLLESELFGYEKGAFTGAERPKPGLLETASGGTVFLDELGEMPLALQAKLLRVIEQAQVLRVGGLKPRTIDVRYVSATNRDLEDAVAQGTFRQDLFYRLNGVTLNLPPLRDRRGEIESLARMFLDRVWRELALPGRPELAPRTLELLAGYRWPGNIRELRNVIERAALLSSGPRIEPEHLPVEKMTASWKPAPSRPSMPASDGYGAPPAGLSNAELDERQHIIAALERCAGNQTRAAKELGISRRTLSSRLTKYAFPRPRKDAE